MPRNPKNINGKDKFHEVKPYRCLDTKKWEIKSLVSSHDEYGKDNIESQDETDMPSEDLNSLDAS